MELPKRAYNKERKTRRINKMRSVSEVSEAAIQGQCEEYLNWMHIKYIRVPDMLYKAVFSGSGDNYLKSFISKYIKGQPDITLLLKDGRYHCVELKTEKGKLSDSQQSFKLEVGEHNFSVIRSFNDFVSLVKDLTDENSSS